MPRSAISSPKSRGGLVDEYFIENRTRILELAAYLDRLDRAGEISEDDYRMRAFREGLDVLADGDGSRVHRVQMIFSDPTTEPLPELDQKSANGAYDRWGKAR